MIHVFTSAAPNYVGKVRALAESVREHCPGVRMHWLVADDVRESLVSGLDREPFDELLFATELDVGASPGWLFQQTLVELSTAIKPAAAKRLLELPGCEMVLYFDPDIVLFSPLDDLLAELACRSLVLTPHQLQPETEPGVLFHELDSLRYGVFNLGFIGLRSCPEVFRFLTWWRDRCLLAAGGDWREGVFTDQKWLNFAPVFFDQVGILKEPRFNVAPWNVSQRSVRGSFDEGFTVDGKPLGFYHFTGFDSGAHVAHLESVQGENRSLRMLVEWYRWRISWLADDGPTPWKLGSYSDGTPIEDLHRRVYRLRPDLQVAFPDPYRVTDGEPCYLEWFRRHAARELPGLFSGSPGPGP